MKNRLLDLSKYRMEKAKDDLDTSEIMFINNKYSQSNLLLIDDIRRSADIIN
ncbi:hypothetical protein H8E88_29610 [candidate division KSB1 bacterium]|nr:hypothetical protein [candidate division KSB1 bacterium]